MQWGLYFLVPCDYRVKAPPDRREIFAATAKPSLQILTWTGTHTATNGSPHTGAKKSRRRLRNCSDLYTVAVAQFFVAVATIVQVSHYNSESSRQLALRMSFFGRLRRVGPDRFHSCFLFSHTSESACMG